MEVRRVCCVLLADLVWDRVVDKVPTAALDGDFFALMNSVPSSIDGDANCSAECEAAFVPVVALYLLWKCPKDLLFRSERKPFA